MTNSEESEDRTPVLTNRVEVDPSSHSPASVVVQKSGGRVLASMAILFSLAALGGSGFTWYQTHVTGVKEESRLAIGVSDIGSQIERLGDTVNRIKQDQLDVVSNAELTNRLMAAKAAVDTKFRDIGAKQAAVQASVLKLNADLQRGVDQLMVEEVSQLLRLANNSVLFGDDIDAAINALRLADNQLKSLRDPRYALVRKQINSELAALRNVSVPDVEALSAQLHTLSGGVPKLVLANEPETRKVEQAATLATQAPLTFRGELVKIWRDLIGSVSIQRVDQPPKPLLVPEQRYFLNENIRLALSKAELALLQGEAEVYQRSLAEAKKWLSEYFDLSDGKVKNSLAQLNRLAEHSITTNIPSISGSYEALQTILGGQ